MSSGYIYVLINPMMEGLVKIGKTNRSPEARVTELSSATGIPVPFILAYDEYFEDCDTAEILIHTFLEQNGHRVATNREFFRIPLNVAIKAIISIKQQSPISGDAQRDIISSQFVVSPSIEATPKNPSTPYEFVISLMEQAEAHKWGYGDTLQDEDRALELYKQAAKLGGVQAYYEVGDIYRDDFKKPKDNKKALEYFIQGAEKGDLRCLPEMAQIFTEMEQLENARKCWSRFFNKLDTQSDLPYFAGSSGFSYFQWCYRNRLPVENVEKLRYLKNEIIKSGTDLKSLSQRDAQSGKFPGLQRVRQQLMSQYDDILAIVERTL